MLRIITSKEDMKEQIISHMEEIYKKVKNYFL